MDVEPERALEQRVRDQQAVGTDDYRVRAELDPLVQPSGLYDGDPDPLRVVREARLAAGEEAAILGGNAARLFRLVS